MVGRKFKIDILIDPGGGLSDPEKEAIAYQLCDEIRNLGVNSAEVVIKTQLRQGVKARGDAISFGTIIVTLATAGVFTAVVETLRAWSLRKESRKVKIMVQTGENVVEFEYSPIAVSEEELLKFTKSILGVIDNQKHKTPPKSK